MHITGHEAFRRGFFEDGAAEENASAASYNLTVGEIVWNGDTRGESRQLEPQETITLVSKERISLPEGVVAYAMPKTGLTNDSILALGTGIVDPGYEGRLSTVAINFGKTPHHFAERDPFLRLVFHKIGDGDVSVDPTSVDDKDYIRERINESLKYPDTFLDVPGRIEEVRSELFEDIQRSTLSQLVVFLAVLTAVFALWNIAGVHLLDRQRQVVRVDTTDRRSVTTRPGATAPVSPFNSAPQSPQSSSSPSE